jgi:hypothetical protein
MPHGRMPHKQASFGTIQKSRRNPDDAAADRAYEEYKQQMEFIAAEFLDRQYDPIINDRMNKKEELLP